jgi:ribosomal peptide maturation radical SAM protein 1
MNEKEKKIDNSFITGCLGRGDVLLLVSPMAWSTTPLLGVHILQAACRSSGITTCILYTNLLFSKLIGLRLHCEIAEDDALYMGEHLFATAAFGIPAVDRCLDKFSDPEWVPDHYWPKKKIENIAIPRAPDAAKLFREWFRTIDWKRLESLATDWTLTTARQIAKLGFPVVGCSTTLGGLVPAIALLDSVKEAASNTITVLGGPWCLGDMAEGIASLKSSIDYIFSGEGEITFPLFVKQMLSGRFPEEKIIYGEAVENLDNSPPPDYQEYFDQAQEIYPNHLSPESFMGIPYETSRGCWYGRCTFCGLIPEKSLYRQKSAGKIINELKVLIKQHPPNNIVMMDNIMPFHYFTSLLPQLAKEIPPINIRYEIKANMSLDQVLTLKKAGVNEIQPGIESLSPSLLRRMNKGVTVRENIALLRYARSVNIKLTWVLLFGLPGDQAIEYEEMVRLLPLIRHLPPPIAVSPFRIYRFSRYQTSPETFGLTNLRPAEIYKDILALNSDFEKIAYCFTADFPTQSHDTSKIIDALWKEFQIWRNAWKPYEAIPLEILLPTLHITRKSSDQFLLLDTRGLPGKSERRVLNREQASILLVARPQNSPIDFLWALDDDLGVLIDSWFIPLATAEPELLREFEGDSQVDT